MKKLLNKVAKSDEHFLTAALNFTYFIFTKPGFKYVSNLAKRYLTNTGVLKKKILSYNDWFVQHNDGQRLKAGYENIATSLAQQPRISIILPITNAIPLQLMLDSITTQLYPNFEVCVATSTASDDLKMLNDFSLDNSRLKILAQPKETDLAALLNSAIPIATGDYLLFISQGDILTIDCLSAFVRHINTHPGDEVIYCDEDKMDDNGKLYDPYFKPDYSPHSLISRNYIGHNIVVAKKLIDRLHGFRQGYSGSEYYDLALRATDSASHTGHISAVVFHSMDQVKNDGYDVSVTSKKAIEDMLKTRETPAVVTDIAGLPGHFSLNYEVRETKKVSIIIPTKDQAKLLKAAIDSIIKKTSYPDYEIIVINNNSSSKEFFELIDSCNAQYTSNFRCIDANFPFNFARLINLGVEESKGDYILMLNNDVEVIEPDWLTRLVSYAQLNTTGAAGAKLLYPDNTIQHAGIALGIGEMTGHVFINAQADERGYRNAVATATNYSALTAACLICRKSAYNEVGGMDEELAVEYNDVDFCLKLLQKGYYNVYVPEVKLFHYESATRGHPFRSIKSFKQHEKDLGIFKAKWAGTYSDDPYFSKYLTIPNTDFNQSGI